MRKKSKKRLSKKQKKARAVRRGILLFLCLATVLGAAAYGVHAYREKKQAALLAASARIETGVPRPELDVELLTINEYSRPGIALSQVNGIVIHYTANPGTTARANRDYFEGLQTSHTTKASSHFVIGLEGEIVQCIPCDEISYASNNRNKDTISIECCIEDDTGKFNSATYQSAIHLTAWLVERYHLEVSDVIRHYDVTGKLCPKYYVEHPEAWTQYLQDVENYINRYK